MTPEATFWIGTMAVFATVALLTVWAGSVFVQRASVVRRLGARGTSQGLIQGLAGAPVTSRLQPASGAGDARERGELRSQLLMAGYFAPNAPTVYKTARLAISILLPLALLVLFQTQGQGLNPVLKFAGLAVGLLLGYVIPDAWIKRRQRLLQEAYRSAFPDVLDLLMVAVDAGLSIEAALERVGGEIEAAGHRELATNFAIMSAEMRAGRGTVDALHGLADRLAIEEVRSFAVLLQQSVELGSNIADALRVYSNEMREKRMARAEERAMALPVKIVLPLGAFIFPVILILILAPVMIRLVKIFNTH